MFEIISTVCLKAESNVDNSEDPLSAKIAAYADFAQVHITLNNLNEAEKLSKKLADCHPQITDKFLRIQSLANMALINGLLAKAFLEELKPDNYGDYQKTLGLIAISSVKLALQSGSPQGNAPAASPN